MNESEVRSEGNEEWRSSKTRPIPIIGPTSILSNKIEAVTIDHHQNSATCFKHIEDVDGKLLLTSDSTQSSNNGSLLRNTPIRVANKGNFINGKEEVNNKNDNNNEEEVKDDDETTNTNKYTTKKNILLSSSYRAPTILPLSTHTVDSSIVRTSSSLSSETKNIKTLSTKISRNGKESVPVGIAVAWQRLVTSDSNNTSSTDTMSCSTSGKSTLNKTSHTPTTPTTTTNNNVTKVKHLSPANIQPPKRPLSSSSIPTKDRGTAGGVVGSDKNGKSLLLGQNTNSKISDQKNRPASVNSIPIHHNHHGSSSLQPHWMSFMKHPYALSGLNTDWSAGLNVPHSNYDSAAAAVYASMHQQISSLQHQQQQQQQLQQLHMSNTRNNNNLHHYTGNNYAVYHGYSPDTLQKYEQYLQQSELHRQHQELQQYHHQLQQQMNCQQEYEIRRASTPIPSPRINIPSPSPTIHSHSLWPPEFFHQNSSMALSPKSLTSTPSPVHQDTSHFLLNSSTSSSNRSRCATPTIIMPTTTSSSPSNNLHHPPPPNITTMATTTTATPVSTSIITFPFSPANFTTKEKKENWKEVKISPVPKTMKKYNGESDDSSSILDVLTIEEEVRREDTTTTTFNSNDNSSNKIITLDGKKNDFSRLESLIEKRDEVSVPLLNQLNPFPDDDKYFFEKDKNDKCINTTTATTVNNTSNTSATNTLHDDKTCGVPNEDSFKNNNNNNNIITTGKTVRETQGYSEIKNEVKKYQSCDVEVDIGVKSVPDKTHLSLKPSKLTSPKATSTSTTVASTTPTIIIMNQNTNSINSSVTYTPPISVETSSNSNNLLSNNTEGTLPLKKTSTTTNINDDNKNDDAWHPNGINTWKENNNNDNDAMKKSFEASTTSKIEKKSENEDSKVNVCEKPVNSPPLLQTKKCIYDSSVVVDMKSASDNDSVTNCTSRNKNRNSKNNIDTNKNSTSNNDNNDIYKNKVSNSKNNNGDIMLKNSSTTTNPIDNNNIIKIKEEVEPIGYENNSIYYGSNASLYNKTQVLSHEKYDIPVKVVNPAMENYNVSFTTPVMMMTNVKKEILQHSLQQQPQQIQPSSISSQPLASTSSLLLPHSSEMNSKNLGSCIENELLLFSNLQTTSGSNSLGTKCDTDINVVKTAPGNSSFTTTNTSTSSSSSYSAISDNSSLVYSRAKDETTEEKTQSQRKIMDAYYHHQQQQHNQMYHPINTTSSSSSSSTMTQVTGNRNKSYQNQLLNVPLPPPLSVDRKLNLKAENRSDTIEKEHILSHRFQHHHNFLPIGLEEENNHLNLLATVAQLAQEFGNDIGSGLMKNTNSNTTTTTHHPVAAVDTYEFVEEVQEKIESFGQSQLALNTCRPGLKLLNQHHQQQPIQQKSTIFSSSIPISTITTNTTTSFSSSSSSSLPISVPVSTSPTLSSLTNSLTPTVPVVLKIPHVTPAASTERVVKNKRTNKTPKKGKETKKELEQQQHQVLNKLEEESVTSKGKGKKKASSLVAVEKVTIEPALKESKKRRKSTTAIAMSSSLSEDMAFGNDDTKVKSRKSSPQRLQKIKKHQKSIISSSSSNPLMEDEKTVEKIVIINTSKNTESKEHKVIMPLNLEKKKSTSDASVMKKGKRSSLGSNLLLQNQSKKDKPIELVLSQVQMQQKLGLGENGSENPSSVITNTTTKDPKKKVVVAKSSSSSSTSSGKSRKLKGKVEGELILGRNDGLINEGQSKKPKKKKEPSQKKLNACSQDLNNKKSKKIPVNTFKLNNKNNNNSNSLIINSSSSNMYSLSKLNDNNHYYGQQLQQQNTFEQQQEPSQKTATITTNILCRDDDDMTELNEDYQMFSPASSSNAENDWATNPTYAVTAIKTIENETLLTNSEQLSTPFSVTTSLYDKSHMSPSGKDKKKLTKPSKLQTLNTNYGNESLINESNHRQTISKKMTSTTLKSTEPELLLVQTSKSPQHSNNNKSFVNSSPRKIKHNGHTSENHHHHHIKPCLKAEPILRTSPERDDDDDDDVSKDIIENIDIISKSRRISTSKDNSSVSPRRVCLQNDDDDDDDEEEDAKIHSSLLRQSENTLNISSTMATFSSSSSTTAAVATATSTFAAETEKVKTGEKIGNNNNTTEGSLKETSVSLSPNNKNNDDGVKIQDDTYEKVAIESVAEMLNDMRILTEIQGLFYTGKLNALQPPDVYGVTLDNERGQPPHFIFSQEEVLEKCIREIKPPNLKTGLRICAYWSPQYSGLYPGRVSVDYIPSNDPQNDLIPIEFDDGDTGVIKLNEIRLLPPHHPISAYDPNPLLTLEKKHRKRRHSSATGSQSGCNGEHEEEDCGESYCAKVGKFEDTEKHSSRVLYWTWNGLGYKKPRSKKDRNKEFFDGIQRGDENINVGDSALFISNGNDRPFIGRVERFWEKKGQKIVHVRWFYHPEEVKTNSRRLQGLKYAGALFESPHIDENDVQTIAKKCEVLPFDEFKEKVGCLSKWPSRNNNTSSSQNSIYYIAGFYDPYTYNLRLNNDLK